MRSKALFNRLVRLAQSPHGKRAINQAVRYAQSPEGKRRVAQVRKQIETRRDAKHAAALAVLLADLVNAADGWSAAGG